MTFSLIATTAFGLESVVRRELTDLGIESSIGDPGRIHFSGDWETVARTNVWLRTADRVLVQIQRFDASDFDALFDTVAAFDWGRWIPADGRVHVTGRSIKSQLTSVPAVQRSVKKAVSIALMRDHGVGELPETGAKYKVDVSLLKDVATITLDTTGPSLHRRGYRLHQASASLKETMAAALVQLSVWRPGRPLIDPFCGAGTIVIEAALIAAGVAPGRDREFAFEAWGVMGDEVVETCRRSGGGSARQPLDPPYEKLIGRDVDDRALRAARENAQRAGVSDLVHFEPGDVRDLTSSRRFGSVVTNPPYGEWIGGQPWELDELYRSLPEVFRRLPTWSHHVLTAYPDFEATVGRNADRRRKLYNGRIECAYFQFLGPKPVAEQRGDGNDAAKLEHAKGDPAFGAAKDHPQIAEHAERFAARLRNQAKHLRRFPKRGITCYRLYERDVPEIPLVVDRYEDHLHVVEFERPHDRDPATHGDWLDAMAATAAEVLEIDPRNVHLKRRGRQRGRSQHDKLGDSGRRIVAHEGGLKFWVNLDDYADTGLFLDHRNTRQRVGKQAAGKRFLNLFSYTGSFAVYAAAGGAASTTNVDLNGNYLDWAADNLRLNGINLADQRGVVADVPAWVADHPPGGHYDLAMVDPPTFSNSKRTTADWDVQRDAVRLLCDVMRIMAPGGVVYFSNNFRQFRLAEDELLTLCPGIRIREITKQTLPEEYRNRRIHRCWQIDNVAK